MIQPHTMNITIFSSKGHHNIEDLAEVAKWFVIMLKESAPQCGFESCCDHHSNHAWNGIYLVCLLEAFFNRQSVYLWTYIRLVPLFECNIIDHRKKWSKARRSAIKNLVLSLEIYHFNTITWGIESTLWNIQCYLIKIQNILWQNTHYTLLLKKNS
jgi:hypothetical protein